MFRKQAVTEDEQKELDKRRAEHRRLKQLRREAKERQREERRLELARKRHQHGGVRLTDRQKAGTQAGGCGDDNEVQRAGLPEIEGRCFAEGRGVAAELRLET